MVTALGLVLTPGPNMIYLVSPLQVLKPDSPRRRFMAGVLAVLAVRLVIDRGRPAPLAS